MSRAGISKLATVAAMAAVVAVASIAVLSWLGFISFKGHDWVHFYTADSLVGSSNTIIVGRLLYEQRITAVPEDENDAAASSSDTFVYAKFDVLESLKGPLAAGDAIFTVTKEGSTGGFFNRWHETVQLENNTVYVLFLQPEERVPGHPAEYGDVVWSASGEPGIAELVDGRLRFLAVHSYTDDVAKRGLTRPWDQSAAPFDLTQTQLITIIATHAGATPPSRMYLRVLPLPCYICSRPA
ncbi:MAG: hypothetical protein FJ319_12175 [SAR202 cluster bacterium]|nr:hypothetical protein [SAR202 cluster bacterium]